MSSRLWLFALWAVSAEAQDVSHGESVAALAACASCHTEADGALFAGGYALSTPFGTFYGTNLTPDPDTGLGDWSLEQFSQAVRYGKSPQGHPYYPAFPYTSFTGLTDTDVADLWAYLQTVAPIYAPNRPHALTGLYRNRFLLRFWRLLAFKRRIHTPDPTQTNPVERGAYLVNVVGHCGECHTPRNGLGKLKRGQWLQGQRDEDEVIPDISQRALADWSLADFDVFLESGMLPNGDFTGGDMSRVIEECTGPLSMSQRREMSLYLRTVSQRERP